MRKDHHEIESSYKTILAVLEKIAADLQLQLEEYVAGELHVDKVVCRSKSVESFMNKAEKQDTAGHYKYEVPLKEIQDKIGARIVVYYKSDVERIKTVVLEYFKRIEEKAIVPDDISKFGYEGYHMICKIPAALYDAKNNPLIGDFFELQIKTLYQHAWSQSNHGLGYKPGEPISPGQERLLAFIAAQSWGADKGLVELTSGTSL